MTARSLSVGFVHPDLGIGGAERLIVDAAVALQRGGHRVVVHTSHHDPARCLEETRDGTLDVRVHRSPIPRHVGGRLLAPCAIARTIVAAVGARAERHDLVFCDLIAHSVAAMQGAAGKIVFYCHYPDKLLVPATGLLRSIYRWPIDRLEVTAAGMADRVLVNSRFTAAAVARAYPSLEGIRPTLLYPGVDTDRFATVPGIADDRGEILLLAISRFSRKKNLPMAVESLAMLRRRTSPDVSRRLRLCIAGGYDDRLEDDRAVMDALRRQIASFQLGDVVRLETNVSEQRKLDLLRECRCVLYTPVDEHFGYVPVEAMASRRPVVVCDSGGPTETVEHARTGMVCAPTVDAFAAALAPVVSDVQLAADMGEAAAAHAVAHFSLDAFRRRLLAIVEQTVADAA